MKLFPYNFSLTTVQTVKKKQEHYHFGGTLFWYNFRFSGKPKRVNFQILRVNELCNIMQKMKSDDWSIRFHVCMRMSKFPTKIKRLVNTLTEYRAIVLLNHHISSIKSSFDPISFYFNNIFISIVLCTLSEWWKFRASLIIFYLGISSRYFDRNGLNIT